MDRLIKPNVHLKFGGDFLFAKELAAYFNRFDSVPISVQRQDGQGHLYRIQQLGLSFSVHQSSTSSLILTSPELPVLASPHSESASVVAPSAVTNASQLSDYLRKLIGNQGASEHETFHHPVAYLNILTPDHATVPTAAETQIFVNYADVLQFHLVLAISSSFEAPIDSRAQELYTRLKKQHGFSTHLLHLIYSPETGFSSDANVTLFLREFTAQNLIPFMDRMIQNWNEQHVTPRKGITGRLLQVGRKYFSSTSVTSTSATGKSSSNLRSITIIYPDSSTSVSIYAYPALTPEATLRRLGDFAFLLGDYKYALSTYDLVKKDFQSDRAFRYYAGVQEMIGLCSLLLKDRRDVENLYDSAVSTYLDISAASKELKDRASKDVFRCALLFHEVYSHHSSFKEAGKSLIRVITEISADKAAILYEQAAYCFYQGDRALNSKYAFHLYLAARKYIQCNQPDDGLRCLGKASLVYKSDTWTAISDEINYMTACQLKQKGNYKEALDHSLLLLHSSTLSEDTQASYFRLFKEAFLETFKSNETSTLQSPLPKIHKRSFQANSSRSKMLTQQQFNDSSPLDHTVEATWKSMESKLSPKTPVKSASFAVREPVAVKLQMSNPMRVTLRLDDLRLICTYSEVAVEVTHSVAMPAPVEKNDNWLVYDGFWLENRAGFVIAPNDIVEIEWKVIPQKTGVLTFHGLSFVLDGALNLSKSFISQRGGKLDSMFQISVTPPMPRLEVSLETVIPESVYSGQIVPLTMVLRNVNEESISSLSVFVSHPSFFDFGASANQGADDKILMQNTMKENTIVDLLPALKSTLKSNETMTVSLSFRGDKIGKHTFRFLFAYKNKAGTSTARFLRFSAGTSVLPSIKISAFSRACAVNIDESIVGLEIENLMADMPISINSIHALSPAWAISSSDAMSSLKGLILKPSQTYFAFFKFKQDSSLVTNEPEKFTARQLENLLLGILDVKQTPGPIQIVSSCVNLTAETAVPKTSPLSFSSSIRKQWRMSTLKSVYSVISESKLALIFPLYATNNLDICVSWSSQPISPGEVTRYGQHYVIGINLGAVQAWIPSVKELEQKLKNAPVRSLYDQTEREKNALIQCILHNRHLVSECFVRASLYCDDVIYVDFSNENGINGLCVIPVSFRMKNYSWYEEPVGYSLELLSLGQGDADGSNILEPKRQDITWIGNLKRTGSIASNKTEVLTLQVCVPRAGLYDLNRWRLVVEYAEHFTSSSFVTMPRGSFLIQVKDSSSRTATTTADVLETSLGLEDLHLEAAPPRHIPTPHSPHDLISF